MSKLTDNAIKETFLRLLEEMPLSKISVKLIVEECGINRNSFYYHYHDIPELMEILVKELMQNVMAEHRTPDTIDDCFNYAFRLLLEHKKAVYHIYNSLSRDIFVKELMKMCDYFIRNTTDAIITDNNLSDKDREILINYYKCACFGLAINWLENGINESIIDDFNRLFVLLKSNSFPIASDPPERSDLKCISEAEKPIGFLNSGA